MKINSYSLMIFTISLATFVSQISCNTNNPEDQSLQAIVDLNDILDQASPSQFAASTFKDCLDKNAISEAHLKTRAQESESKTTLFQQSFFKYIKEIFNKRNYATFLSQDGSDIIHFVEAGNELNLGSDMLYVGIRLFYNKIKAAELVDDTVVIQLLNELPHMIERHFGSKKSSLKTYDLSFIKKNLETVILAKFTEHRNLFDAQPDTFIANLASDLAIYYQQEHEKIKKQVQQQEVSERLRNQFIRFFETMINKTIWAPQAPESIWKSFIGIANGVQLLGNYRIIEHMDDLDDLLWSLTHRFCFFLDLTGAALPISFYEEVESDLDGRAVFFLEHQEQDPGIVTKKETFISALTQAKARAIAYHQSGIISMPVKGL